MHQDLTYWGLDNNEYQVTAWLALSISNKSSGCMDFVKESFRNPILPHNDTFSKDNLLSRGQEIKVDILEKDRFIYPKTWRNVFTSRFNHPWIRTKYFK